MKTLIEQGIDTKKIDYVIFERPSDFCTISFKDGGVMSKTLNHLNQIQIKKLEILLIKNFIAYNIKIIHR